MTAIEAITLIIRMSGLNLSSDERVGVSEVEYDIQHGVFRLSEKWGFGPHQHTEWDPWEPWTAGGAKFDADFRTESDRLFEEVRRNSWEHLKKALSRSIETGAYLAQGRLRAPLAPFSRLDMDQWGQLKITDWSAGNGEFDSGERVFSLHAANAASLKEFSGTWGKGQRAKAETEDRPHPTGRGRAWKSSLAEQVAKRLSQNGDLPRTGRKDQVGVLRQALGREAGVLSDSLLVAAIRKVEGRSISPDPTGPAD